MLAYKLAYLTLSVTAGNCTSIRPCVLLRRSHINIDLPSNKGLVYDLTYLAFSGACSSALFVGFLRLIMKFETPKYAKIHSSSCERTIIGISNDFQIFRNSE